MIQKTISISERYKDDVNKILDMLPKREQSRFICQAIIEKAKKIGDLSNYDEPIENFISTRHPEKIVIHESSPTLAKEEPIQTNDESGSNHLVSLALFIINNNQSEMSNDPMILNKVINNDMGVINKLILKYPEAVSDFSSKKHLATEDNFQLSEKSEPEKKDNSELKKKIKSW